MAGLARCFCERAVVALLCARAAQALLLEGGIPPNVINFEHMQADSAAAMTEEIAVDVSAISFDVSGTTNEVVLNGEPKSGTTWLEFVAKEILTVACQEDHACNLIHNERTVTTESRDGMLTYSLDEKHTIPEVGHINKFDFSHAPSLSDADVDKRAQKYLANVTTKNKKWLVVFRDPRAVTLSSCYHMYKNCPDAGGFSLKRIESLTKWINLRYRFFKSLERQVEKGRVLVLFYEDLRKDELTSVRTIANFFGVKLSAKQAKQVQKSTTMDAMKEQEQKKKVPTGGAATGKVREGATCGYGSELSAEAAVDVTSKMRKILEKELNDKWSC